MKPSVSLSVGEIIPTLDEFQTLSKLERALLEAHLGYFCTRSLLVRVESTARLKAGGLPHRITTVRTMDGRILYWNES